MYLEIKNNLDENMKNLQTKKVRFSNNYKTLVYAVPYLKMLSAAQNYSMANRQCVKYNLRFYFFPCF